MLFVMQKNNARVIDKFQFISTMTEKQIEEFSKFYSTTKVAKFE